MSHRSSSVDKSVAIFNSGIIKFHQDFSKDIDVIPFGGDSLDGYKSIIITTGAFIENTERNVRGTKDEFIRRHREVYNALRRGSHVCILLNDASDYLVPQLLSDVKGELTLLTKPTPALKTKKSEFQPFLDKYGTSFAEFKNVEPAISIATTQMNEHDSIVAFSKIVFQGIITFLPFFLTESQKLQQQDITDLITSLNYHKTNVLSEPPTWIDCVKFKKEEAVEQEISDLKIKLTERYLELDYFKERKKLLWSKGDVLRDLCMTILQDMGLEIYGEDVGEEDFWIGFQKENAIIVEVKGKDHGIKRDDLYALDTHRSERNKPDHFPALLLINTLNRAQSLKEKDAPIPPDEIRRAVQLNLLIMRTIDLVLLFELFQNNQVDTAEIMETLRKEHGWMKVTRNGIEMVLK